MSPSNAVRRTNCSLRPDMSKVTEIGSLWERLFPKRTVEPKINYMQTRTRPYSDDEMKELISRKRECEHLILTGVMS